MFKVAKTSQLYFLCCNSNELSKFRIARCGMKLYHSKAGTFGYRKETNESSEDDVGKLESRFIHGKYYQLVQAYREHGHKISCINPVQVEEIKDIPELNFETFHLNLTETYDFSPLVASIRPVRNTEQAMKFLHSVYCGTMSVEFTYLEDNYEKEWFAEEYEKVCQIELTAEEKLSINRELIKSQVLDRFLASKFVSLKRYGGEGAETMMAFFIELFKAAAKDDLKRIVIGAHHRGRLNLLIGLLKMDPRLLFRKLAGKSEFPEDMDCIGDVISHLCPSSRLVSENKEIEVTLTNLPSHLEAVSPVSLGRTRALQLLSDEAHYRRPAHGRWSDTVLNVQVHGDAALMGQGVCQESLLLSQLPHFEVGGTVHLVINNQLGFTTSPDYGRGTRYASDIAKIISAPVIHVNGEHPEDVLKASRLAIKYQRKFRKNIFIDLNCYRKWGHNELDDPTFTNPILYNIINSKKTIPDSYCSQLIEEGVISENEVEDIQKNHSTFLNDSLKTVDSYKPVGEVFCGPWKGYRQAPHAVSQWDTGVHEEVLQLVGSRSVHYPQDFTIHPHLLKNHIKARLTRLNEGTSIDWSTAEALAFGSLLFQGYNIRISGQDVGRGTFSHRHAMFVDQKTDEIYIPLNNISTEQSSFLEVANSMLSEEAVLGFEYGFSNISPNNLVIWEAQFGDFFNGAQIQFDTYVTSGECKWMSQSGLVVLLPHGYDGAGAEHSSCRLERFLQLTNSSEDVADGEDVNVHIAFPTTPAQYFHLLRRQMVRNYRKPLIMAGPKTLIRAPEATSPLSHFSPGSSFSSVIGDSSIKDEKTVQKIIFVSGKHYYALVKARQELGATDTAIIRLEELCPFPLTNLKQEVDKYPNAKEYVWSQEEPQNMGAWTFCKPRFENLVGIKLKFCGRKPLAAPAVGIGELHQVQAKAVIYDPFRKN